MGHSKKEKIYRFGERFAGTKTKNCRPQDYDALLESYLKAGRLFEDPEFLCSQATVLGFGDPEFNVVWKRPSEITENPKFMKEGFSRFDIQQGWLGNCWMAASIGTLTLHPEVLKNVVPSRQTFKQGEYAGIFHFRFWKFNRWIDVPVDDRLPVNEGGNLAFMTSSTDREFWSALLEKAYAKGAGAAGYGAEAFATFIGKLTEQLTLTSATKDFFGVLQRALNRNSLVICLITVLVDGSREMNLIRLRNPWRTGEWRGPWSDNSKQWDKISKETRQELGLVINDDGEFC